MFSNNSLTIVIGTFSATVGGAMLGGLLTIPLELVSFWLAPIFAVVGILILLPVIMFAKHYTKIVTAYFKVIGAVAVLSGLVHFSLPLIAGYDPALGTSHFFAVAYLALVWGAVLLPIFSYFWLVADYRHALPATLTYAVALILSTPLWIVVAPQVLDSLATRTLSEGIIITISFFTASFFIPALLAVLIAWYFRRGEEVLA